MGYVNKGEDFLPGISLNELDELCSGTKNVKAKMRLLCVIHRKKGKTIEDITESTGLARSTVSDYLRRIDEKGLASLDDVKNKGAEPRLLVEQLQKLDETLSEPPARIGMPFPFWTTKLVQVYIQEQFNKKYTLHGIRKLLYRLGYTRQKPRQIHRKGDKIEQEIFKKKPDGESNTTSKRGSKSSSWTKSRSC
jgi:transposase